MYRCRSWREKFQKAEEKKSSELKYLRRCGIAIEIDFHERDKQPCLVNLAADPMLSGTLLYVIPPGLVRVGKNSGSEATSKKLDIMLDGPLVRELHWLVTNCVCAFTLILRRDERDRRGGEIE